MGKPSLFEAILINVDGTLFQTEKVTVPAFLQTFDGLKENGKENGLYTGGFPDERERVKISLREQGLRHVLMAGDHRSDIEAGRAMGLTTIGCRDSFAKARELKDADRFIETKERWPNALADLLHEKVK
jgi:beta-phosphoglucomutase-like phosphatase (HAD superfamily)